ncbi:MAG: isocitrate lyase/phosphoenolpyruvate mutase family protein [Jatrophihabitantaceae bacterium]
MTLADNLADSLADKAAELRRLHTDPELLVLVNVWDVASAKVVAGLPGCRAVATASHSIAASFGYPDGEQIPAELMIEAVGRIAAAVTLPVTADLEAGYGDVGDTIRKAIGVGVVGANIEDEMRPLDEAVAGVRAAVRAGEAEGVPFVLNARTDAYLLDSGRDPAELLADAIKRGRAFLDAGADCVFVPGRLDAEVVRQLVEGIGQQKVSILALPGTPEPRELAELGVARVSFGPWSQRVAMTSLADVGTELLAGAGLPTWARNVS